MQSEAPSSEAYEEAVLTMAELQGWHVSTDEGPGIKSYVLLRRLPEGEISRSADDMRYCVTLDAVIKVLEQQ